jgi:diaminopimelate decarboxylase
VAKFKSSLPWINVHYAMKANPIDELVRDVIENGAGLDCASRAEIQEAIDLANMMS